MHKLADISTFESLYNRSCGAVFNSGPSQIPYLANISLFEGLMIHNAAGLPMTRERYNQLKEELKRLEQEELPAVREQVAAARAEGDLSENAEYHASRGRIAVTSPLAKAFLGAKEGDTVTFKTPSGKERQYHIDKISYGDEVGAGSDDPDAGAEGC